MKTSDQTDAIAKALATAQSEMKNATINSVNPHFKNRYADLAAIRDAVVPALTKSGIAVTQATECDGGGFWLTTRLSHESGHWMEGTYPLERDKPQSMGSQMTYARRYALSSMCAISADEDDDAEGASKGGGAPSAPATIKTEDISKIQAMIIDADADLPKFLKAVAVQRIDDIPASKLDWVVGLLNKKIADNEKGQA